MGAIDDNISLADVIERHFDNHDVMEYLRRNQGLLVTNIDKMDFLYRALRDRVITDAVGTIQDTRAEGTDKRIKQLVDSEDNYLIPLMLGFNINPMLLEEFSRIDIAKMIERQERRIKAVYYMGNVQAAKKAEEERERKEAEASSTDTTGTDVQAGG